MSTQPETKVEAEALVPQFKLERVLNQARRGKWLAGVEILTSAPPDQNGRRISLAGSIADKPALITLERAALPTDSHLVTVLLKSLGNVTNLGANDIYRWYMASRTRTDTTHTNLSTNTNADATATADAPSLLDTSIPDVKLNLIYPCTAQHIKKYSAQRVRMVTETPDIYAHHIRPYMARQRSPPRLDWIFNILDGRTEQDDVIARVDWDSPSDTGFLLLPDLNWDRKSVEGMHLLALVQRRDLWSLRDLRKKHVPWLKAMRRQIVRAAAETQTQKQTQTQTQDVATATAAPPLEEDQLKCYIHYQPTYYHFHIHVVHAMLEAGTTQSVGKAFGLGNVIAQLESMAGGDDAGMHQVDMHYFVGEESELWGRCFGRLKKGQPVDLNVQA
ncbi:hypothetical protein G647_07515 [Cladophialophora carrionii CBS 160.54]|uniref:Scavenger mRNA decapping enzyme n=1 Tax=Cladophialophora carrionii CBS 160.54 TaxID=1279043 RepID=V9D3C7_9EURO|nr:uncharacterized protein G647_07515 [Cladophialophora carrionii CBS 160.54]ETI21171.1 hypothetical protein G647_07515 [Cladophialophora carrionii CBS 160.54]